MARPAGRIDRPIMPKIRKPATCNWPTTNSRAARRGRQQWHAQRDQHRSHQRQRADQAQQHEDRRRCVVQRQFHQRPVAGPADDDDREVEIDDRRPCIGRSRCGQCADAVRRRPRRRPRLRGSRKPRTRRECRAACAAAPAPPRLPTAGRRAGMIDDGPGRIDRPRVREPLHARRDVDGLSEIILPVVEHDREAGPLMDADLEQQILAAVLGVEGAHRLAHAQRRGHRPVRGRKRRHDRVADRLDDGAGLGGDDLVQHPEMRPHQVEGDEVADPIVEFGRALQVGEQEGQAGDLEPLVEVERVGSVDVAEGLVGQQPLRGQERPAPRQQSMQRVSGDPDPRQRAGRCGFRATGAAGRGASRRCRSAPSGR